MFFMSESRLLIHSELTGAGDENIRDGSNADLTGPQFCHCEEPQATRQSTAALDRRASLAMTRGLLAPLLAMRVEVENRRLVLRLQQT